MRYAIGIPCGECGKIVTVESDGVFGPGPRSKAWCEDHVPAAGSPQADGTTLLLDGHVVQRTPGHWHSWPDRAASAEKLIALIRALAAGHLGVVKQADEMRRGPATPRDYAAEEREQAVLDETIHAMEAPTGEE